MAADPRANQKQRTRQAIVEAAAGLLKKGTEPTVAAAAEAAGVSRATAYRYFPTPESLQIEVAGVTPAFAPVDELIDGLETEDVEDRLDRFVTAFNAITFREEARMRMALKVYLETWFAAQPASGRSPRVREGRRMRWLDKVLAPLRKTRGKQKVDRLQAALALTTGADALVVMKDVCGLSDKEARATLLWATRALLAAHLQETGTRSNAGIPRGM